MADASLAALSDPQFVEECRNALNALYEAVVNAEAVAMTKPYIPENYAAAYQVVFSVMPRVREFASSRLDNLAAKYGISGVGNWMIDFHNDIDDVKFIEMKAQYVSVVLKRFNAINALRNIIRSDTASGSGNLIDRLLAGPDDVVLEARDLAFLEAHLKQPVSLSTIQQEKQRSGRSETQERRKKLKLIRDFNVGLQKKEYPPGEMPLDPATIVSIEGKLASVKPHARANTVVHGMVLDLARSLGGKENANEIQSNPTPAVRSARRSTKRSTERGEGKTKLVAALVEHHQYSNEGCLNYESIGNNELADKAGVSPSTASAFFQDEFGGHMKYRKCCRDTGTLIAVLKLLNGDLSPYNLYGSEPPEKRIDGRRSQPKNEDDD